MRRATSRYSILLRGMGLVIALVLLAACARPGTPTPTISRAPMPQPGAEWDYVVLGDSRTWGFPDYYAAHIEADLGVKVTVHYWSRDGQMSGSLLLLLRNNQELRSDISEAEVVTFFGNAGRGYCGGIDTEDCFGQTLTDFRANLDAIIAEILSLRSTSDTIIRTMDWFHPCVKENKEDGIFEECKRCIEALNEQIVQAASEHNIPVVRTHPVFNGPDGDEDAREKGYVQADGLHHNEAGRVLIADLHRELGYEYAGP